MSLFRYVGENYSNAQEAMENTMQFFYSQNSNHRRPVTPAVGQLVAIRGEDGDELARAQVVEVAAPNKVKVTSLCRLSLSHCFLLRFYVHIHKLYLICNKTQWV